MKLGWLLIGGDRIRTTEPSEEDTNYPSHTSSLHSYLSSLTATSSIISTVITAIVISGIVGTPPHAIKSYYIKIKLITSHTNCMEDGNGHTCLSLTLSLTARSTSGVRLTMGL